MVIYENTIPLNLSEMLDNKTISEVIDGLQKLSKMHEDTAKFTVLKSELGQGSVVYLIADDKEISSINFAAKALKSNRDEWERISKYFSKDNITGSEESN